MSKEYSQSVTGYGFIAELPQDNIYGRKSFDLFVPQELAQHLQLKYGVSFLFQFGVKLRGKPKQESSEVNIVDTIFVRQRTGIEQLAEVDGEKAEGANAFTATFRFKNEPGELGRFLKAALGKMSFKSMRTFGFRDEFESDLIFECRCDDEDSKKPTGFVRGSKLQSTFERFDREVTSATLVRGEELEFHNRASGRVGTSIFMLDLPVVGGRFMRLNLPNLDGLNLNLGGKYLSLVRLVADYGTVTLEADTRFSQGSHYLIRVACLELRDAAPVTERLLRTLKECSGDRLNVDYISGAEYFRPKPNDFDPIVKGTQVGQLELLCTSREKIEIDIKVVKEKIESDLESLGKAEKVLVKVELIDESLANLSRRIALEPNGDRADIVSGVFREVLAGGRYAFVEELGKGHFGRVDKYMDLMLGRMVAVKKFNRGVVRADEIKASGGDLELAWLLDEYEDHKVPEGRQNLVGVQHIFFDGDTPRIIMQCLDFSLQNHFSNPRRSQSNILNSPANLAEFVGMATQLLNGLRELHQSSRGTYLHRDISPSNIGGLYRVGKKVPGPDVQWKLMDFGLAKQIGGRGLASAVGGGAYVSPQALNNEASPSDDIYALGVVFFQICCVWRHPSRSDEFARVEVDGENFPVPAEVKAAYELLQNREVGRDQLIIKNYSSKGWKVADWLKLEREGAEDGLRGFIMKMIALNKNDRYRTAEEAIVDLNKLQLQWELGEPRM